MERLTDAQFHVYMAIKNYIDKYGFSPSFRELGELTDKSSPASIHYELKILKRKGYIDYLPKLSRTIRVLK